MMNMTVVFESMQDVMEFVGAWAPVFNLAKPQLAETVSTQKVNVPSAPVQPGQVPTSPAAQTPATTPAQVEAPSQTPVTPPQQQVIPPTAPIPTTTTTYNLDDLARAAMTLMDSGRQAELQQLLSRFGVQSLPELPPAQFGVFATELRTMGAQI